jgi:hypothetical protein
LKGCIKHVQRAKVALILIISSFTATWVVAQTPPAANTEVVAGVTPSVAQVPDDRILGLIPNYLTVEDPQQRVMPLTAKDKFVLFAKETIDPFTVLAAAGGAGLSQIDNDAPKYGRGSGPFAERFGAAAADITTQNFFSDAVMASLLHEDPRYFRRGPEFSGWYRVWYALTRVVVTRTDKGTERFNFSGMLGMGMGIALSNAYYPDSSVSGSEVASRFGTSFAASALGNLLPEFWPDFHEKFFHRKPRPPAPTLIPSASPTPAHGD